MTWMKTAIKCNACALFVLLNLAPLPIFAKAHTQHLDNHYQLENGLFFGIEGGYVKPSLKKSTTVLNGSTMTPPNNSDFYTINNPSNSSEFAGYAGYRFAREASFLPSVTLAGRYQHINKFSVNGTVQQYSLSDFTNYNYSFDLQSDVLTAQGKAELFQWHFFMPYLSAGIGTATNKFGNYNETAMSGIIARLSPAYANRSMTNFTYNVGAGIDFRFNQNFTASVNYEYADLGTVKSGRGEADNWTGEELQIGLLRAQMISLSLFYQLS